MARLVFPLILVLALLLASCGGSIQELRREDGSRLVVAGREVPCVSVRDKDPNGPNIVALKCYYDDNGEEFISAVAGSESLIQSIFKGVAAGVAVGIGLSQTGSRIKSTTSTVTDNSKNVTGDNARVLIDSPSGVINK